jgi:hypothetical protein
VYFKAPLQTTSHRFLPIAAKFNEAKWREKTNTMFRGCRGFQKNMTFDVENAKEAVHCGFLLRMRMLDIGNFKSSKRKTARWPLFQNASAPPPNCRRIPFYTGSVEEELGKKDSAVCCQP